MKKKVKIPLIIGISLAVLTGVYFVGGILAFDIVTKNLFGVSPDTLNPEVWMRELLTKCRKDYECLNSREEMTFESGNNYLQGYLYEGGDKGVVIAAHGLSSNSNGHEAQYQAYFVEQGYDVFAIDLTASGNSGGDGIGGLHQSAYDVANAYKFLKNKGVLQGKTILAGYSWGAYGVAASLNLGVEADYVITISAFDNPFDCMLDKAVSSAGSIVYATYPTFVIGSSLEFGNDARLSASEGLKKANCPSLIIQGARDKMVTVNGSSLYAKAGDIPNATALLLPEATHNGPWRTQEANEYLDECLRTYKKMYEEGKPGSELDAYASSVDKNRSSAFSPVVAKAINDLLSIDK